MILRALCEYYERKAADPESGIPLQGFELKEIPFIIVIDRCGKFVALEDTRQGEGRKKRARSYLVPQGAKRAGSVVKANLLWDTVEYAVRANPRGRRDVTQRADAFVRRLVEELPPRSNDWRVSALLSFLENEPSEAIATSAGPLWQDALNANANVTFRIEGDEDGLLTDAFRERIAATDPETSAEALCLVSGGSGAIPATHPAIKGVRGAQSAGASIVSFNESAYTSFGKKQNRNAPVSAKATFAYTMGLNTLLGKDSRNCVQIGDATAVFWSEQRSLLEDTFADFFEAAPKDDPDRETQAVRSLYRSLQDGGLETGSATRFYVLGLAPSAARLSVRFWHHGTVAEMSGRLRQHFDDLEIVCPKGEHPRYALFWLLVELASERKIDNVPPNLAGAIVRAVLDGLPYPATLVQQAVRRARAERTITPTRAAILKAYLNRFQRTYPRNEKEITVSLDPDNENVGYRLGRLFAVLEKIQLDAHQGIKLNATIRDRHYGAASANPTAVFPQLLKLATHHLKKIDEESWVRAHERRLTEVFSGLPPDMPSHLRMEDQARFAIGYYHQRQALYTKVDKDGASSPDGEPTEKEAS